MTAPLATIRVARAFGPVVEGEAVVSTEGFSPRYDLDRWTGLISKPGHKLEGTNINMLIVPGQVSKLTVTFDKPGVYTWVCHEYCGLGHAAMFGQVTVTE